LCAVLLDLRKFFNVDPADYMIYISGYDTFRELSSLGQSTKFYYLGNADKYVIKTMKKPEVEVTTSTSQEKGNSFAI